MVTRVIQPSSERPILKENGSPAVQLNTWLKVITDRALIVGKGSPESIVEASQGAMYMDEDGLIGNILYIKQKASDSLGDKTKEWKLIG